MNLELFKKFKLKSSLTPLLYAKIHFEGLINPPKDSKTVDVLISVNALSVAYLEEGNCPVHHIFFGGRGSRFKELLFF